MLDDLAKCIIFVGIFFSSFSCFCVHFCIVCKETFFLKLFCIGMFPSCACVWQRCCALAGLLLHQTAPEAVANVSVRSRAHVLAVAVANALMMTAGYLTKCDVGNKHRLSL